jgi:hypothetical protein
MLLALVAGAQQECSAAAIKQISTQKRYCRKPVHGIPRRGIGASGMWARFSIFGSVVAAVFAGRHGRLVTHPYRVRF